MKLNELTGAKSALTHVGDGFRSDVQSQPITTYLNQLGFQQLGREGQYAKVFAHPKMDYVLKVFAKDDIGYRTFLDFCDRQGPSKYLPRFVGRPVDLEPKTGIPAMAVRMERLKPAFGNDAANDAVWEVQMAIQDVWGADEDYFQERFRGIAPADLVSIMYRIIRYPIRGGDIRLDLHGGNYMLRGNTVVFTDPYRPDSSSRELPDLF